MPENESAYIVAEESTFTEEVSFIETNAEDILNRLIERFELYTGDKLYPGDERRIFLQGFAYVLAEETIHINETGRGNLLKYAMGNQLDAIGELYSNKRLDADPATVELKITISASGASDIIIPAGFRATPDGEHFFATDEMLIFPAKTSTLSKVVTATAVEPGEGYNGFLVGQIENLVDTSPYIQSVTNTTISNGGTDPETDEDYRQRLRLSPFSFSVAGPAEAYRAIAMSVSTDIEDVYVYSPSAGVVEIVLSKTGGVIPAASDDLIERVLDACSEKTVRPLTDNVQVVPATAANTEVNIQYYVANGDMSVTTAIMKAVEEYKTWQTSKIGRDINPDYLNKLLIEAGAARVVINSPAYQSLAENELAQIGSINISYAGSINM